MEIIIKPLTLNIIDDWLYFFNNVAFTDNPEWCGCYCRFYHFDGSIKEWENQSKEENRNASIKLIRSGVMHGFLAYSNNNPVGWCNANTRDNYAKILYKDDSGDSENQKIAGIVCFLIGPLYRKRGIARELLRYAISHYKNKGYEIIESYPRIGKLSDAHSYRGPISLYQTEGFKIYKRFKDFYVMRLDL
ncbi:MAG: GNAT family N-acetyltransferase [Promethearchaeota archaeon]